MVSWKIVGFAFERVGVGGGLGVKKQQHITRLLKRKGSKTPFLLEIIFLRLQCKDNI